MTPNQGKRERVYVFATFMRDDNGDEVEGSFQMLGATSSLKVGEKAFSVFKEHRNGVVTMVHEERGERFFPSETPNLHLIMGGKVEEEKEPESIDLLNNWLAGVWRIRGDRKVSLEFQKLLKGKEMISEILEQMILGACKCQAEAMFDAAEQLYHHTNARYGEPDGNVVEGCYKVALAYERASPKGISWRCSIGLVGIIRAIRRFTTIIREPRLRYEESKNETGD